VGVNPVVRFAAGELARYLEKMTEVKHNTTMASPRLSSREGIYLGTVEDLEGLGVHDLCEKSELDDITVLKTVDNALFITGSNPRSVLFAAYRYLELLGAEWLWPGRDGEILPKIERARTYGFEMREQASYRHRGVCIEGAVSPEIVIGFIDWMAKRRMNEFFLQFKTSQYFYNRYYSRQYNPRAKPLPKLSVEEALKTDAQVIEEAKKRGMIIERVGHGWTCGALGIEGLGWDKTTQPLSEKQKELIALINGKRELFGGVAVNTELCYSNPEAFNLLVNHVVQYALDHPEVDILHFWLSDGMNNHCECPNCQKLSPSDWYARLVNTISSKLAERNCSTRIVFLCYANTLWPPIQENIEDNYRNTIFMFAPITRCYIHRLTDSQCAGSVSLEPPPRNRVAPPRTNCEFTQLLRAWQQRCQSDSFLFDYHFWFGMDGLDFLIGNIGRILWHDIRDLRELGLNGFLSCQTLRAFYPTGIPMAILANTAWNSQASLEEIIKRYLKAAFGEEAAFVSNYLEKIYSFVLPAENYAHRDPVLAADLDKLQELLKFVRKSRERLRRVAKEQRSVAQKKAVFYLLHHNRYMALVLEAAVLYSKGETDKAVALVEKAMNHFLSTEAKIFKVADVYLMKSSLERIKAKYMPTIHSPY